MNAIDVEFMQLFTKSFLLVLSECQCHVKPNQMQLYLVFGPVSQVATLIYVVASTPLS